MFFYHSCSFGYLMTVMEYNLDGMHAFLCINVFPDLPERASAKALQSLSSRATVALSLLAPVLYFHSGVW